MIELLTGDVAMKIKIDLRNPATIAKIEVARFITLLILTFFVFSFFLKMTRYIRTHFNPEESPSVISWTAQR